MLFISIVMAVVIMMFIGAAIGLGPANLVAGQNTLYRDQAQLAAESGAQYALSQLHKDPAWRGDQNKITVNTPGLYVIEDNGNVIGILTTPDGTKSQFRLRFNYRDGNNGGDGLPNSGQDVPIPYVSLNNLTGGAEAVVPRADGPGFSVTAASATPFRAPIWSASLAVEGRAGKGLDQVSPTNPNPPGLVGATRVVVEGIYQVPDLGPGLQESALMAAGGFKSVLKAGKDHNVELVSKSPSGVPKLRSKGLVEVTGGDPLANLVGDKKRPDIEVSSSDGNVTGVYDPSTTAIKQEKAVDPFYQLVWNDVKKPDPSGPKLNAGTYVWWDDGTIHYYDMDYTTYVDHIKASPTDAGVSPAPLAGGMVSSFSKGKPKLTLNSSVTIAKTTATSDFSLIIRQGAAEVPPDALGTSAYQTQTVTDALVDQVSTTILSQGKLKTFIETTQSSQNGRIEMWDPKGGYIGMISWNPDGMGSIVVNTSGNTNTVLNQLISPGMYPTSQETKNSLSSINVSAVASQFGITAGEPPGEINAPGVTDSLTASDVQIEFAGDTQPVVLYGDGNIRITGGVKGKGGSIVAGGDLRVTGMGADFSALTGTTTADGVNMYSRGDMFFSTLDKEASGFKFQDIKLKGIVYTWGDFTANLGNPGSTSEWGDFEVEGALIAYGGDPAGKVGANGKGMVQIAGKDVKLHFDPAYAGGLSSTLPPGYKLKPISWSNNLP